MSRDIAGSDILGSSVPTGTFTLANDALEQDAIIFVAAKQIVHIRFDMNACVGTIIVREKEQVNAADYRQLSVKAYPADFDLGTKAISITHVCVGVLYKVTMQAQVAEGVARDIPYRYMAIDLT